MAPPICLLDTLKGLLDCYPVVPHISLSVTVAEEEEPLKTLIKVFTKVLMSVKVSPIDALKSPKFDWNLQDQYEDFWLFKMGIESFYKLQGIPNWKVITFAWSICSTSWVLLDKRNMSNKFPVMQM